MAIWQPKQTRALGRRYSWDPYYALAEEELRQKYALMPGQEARRIQQEQFGQTMGLERERMEGQETAAMYSTGGNLLTTGMMLNAYRGKPLLGEWGGAGTPTTGMTGGGISPLAERVPLQEQMAYNRANWGDPNLYATPAAYGAGASDVAVTGYSGMTGSQLAIEGYGAAGEAGAGAGLGISGYAAPAAAGYYGAKYGPDLGSGEVGKAMATGVGLRGNERVERAAGGSIRGAGAGAIVGTMIMPGVGTIAGTIIGAIVGGLTSYFGW